MDEKELAAEEVQDLLKSLAVIMGEALILK